MPEGSLHVCGPHQVWLLRNECCGRGVPTKVVCAECMKMCCLGGKNSVVKGLIALQSTAEQSYKLEYHIQCHPHVLTRIRKYECTKGTPMKWSQMIMLYHLQLTHTFLSAGTDLEQHHTQKRQAIRAEGNLHSIKYHHAE